MLQSESKNPPAPQAASPAPPVPPAAAVVEPGCPTLPRHVAIIMDGNGRWARTRGEARTFGHAAGAQVVRTILEESARLGIEALTLYSFSTENWARSSEEVRFLMQLYIEHLISERDQLQRNNVRLVQIGRREGLPEEVLRELDRTTRLTADNTGTTLAIAVNYGSRTEITDAVREIAAEVRAGRLDPRQITEQTISDHLYTAGLPDPDLLIRTAGEMRVSNYLLWQISYAELYMTQVCWPDFQVQHYHQALATYARRKRKFGAAE